MCEDVTLVLRFIYFHFLLMYERKAIYFVGNNSFHNPNGGFRLATKGQVWRYALNIIIFYYLNPITSKQHQFSQCFLLLISCYMHIYTTSKYILYICGLILSFLYHLFFNKSFKPYFESDTFCLSHCFSIMIRERDASLLFSYHNP